MCDLYFIFTALAGGAYSYFLICGHFLSVRLDREFGVPRSADGEIRIHDLKEVLQLSIGTPLANVSRKALFYLKISNIIAVGYLVIVFVAKFYALVH